MGRPTAVVDADPPAVKRLLHALHEKGLIESQDGGPVLTAKGQIVVTQYLERVNDGLSLRSHTVP